MKTSSLLAAVAVVISSSSIGSVSARPEEAFFFEEPCIGAMDEFCPAGYDADAELPSSVADELKDDGLAPASLLSEDVITCGIVGLLGLFTKADGLFCSKLLVAAGYCCSIFDATMEPTMDYDRFLRH